MPDEFVRVPSGLWVPKEGRAESDVERVKFQVRVRGFVPSAEETR